MAEFFGREFSELDWFFLEKLHTLEDEGCVYDRFWREDLEKFDYCRIQFNPDEIVEFVDALHAYDEFLEYVSEGYSRETALEKISNSKIRERVKEYNEWAEEDQEYCPAAFYGGELEALLTGSEMERYEFFEDSFKGNRLHLLDELVEGIPESATILQDRRDDRPDFEISCEQDFQDLFFALIKPIFPTAISEEPIPQHATKSKKIDFVIPEMSLAIELKYVRDERHAKNLSDELKVDIESYHKHPDCTRMKTIVWDEQRLITDRSNFEGDLTGPRTIDGSDFQVETIVLS